MKHQSKQREQEANATDKKPNLRIVTAEELTTGQPKPRHRSALVQQFLALNEQIDADINRILAL